MLVEELLQVRPRLGDHRLVPRGEALRLLPRVEIRERFGKVVEKRVPDARVPQNLETLVPGARQRVLQALRRARVREPLERILLPEVRLERTRDATEVARVRAGDAVEGRRARDERGGFRLGRDDQGQRAAHAEADDADAGGALGPEEPRGLERLAWGEEAGARRRVSRGQSTS